MERRLQVTVRCYDYDRDGEVVDIEHYTLECKDYIPIEELRDRGRLNWDTNTLIDINRKFVNKLKELVVEESGVPYTKKLHRNLLSILSKCKGCGFKKLDELHMDEDKNYTEDEISLILSTVDDIMVSRGL